MATLNRIRVTWTGFKGGPGVSTFYAATVTDNLLANLRTFYSAFANTLPTGLTIQVPNQGDSIEDSTGTLNGGWSLATLPTAVVGTAGTSYSGSTGAIVTWQTSALHNGRHLRGRTYLVPMTLAAFVGGVLQGPTQAQLQSAADALTGVSGVDLRVWGRPKAGAGGTSSAITGAVVPALAAVLRSRRD